MDGDIFKITADGLASFPELREKFAVPNAITFDNALWGNMNPIHSPTDEDKLRIAKNDRIIAREMGVDHLFSMTTPHEDTFMHLEKDSYEYLRMISARKDDPFIETPIKANAVVVDDSIETPFELVIAPADCATLTFVHPDWGGLVFMHVGSPQVVQKLDLKVMTYVEAAYPQMDLSKMVVYISPYICKEHYSISTEKNKNLDEKEPLKRAGYIFGAEYVEKGESPVFKGPRIYLDFMGTVKSRLRENFGISEFIESGICNYESAQEEKLFSNELYQELVELSKKDKEIIPEKAKGTFNVIVTYHPNEL